jgi:hypothetical protein
MRRLSKQLLAMAAPVGILRGHFVVRSQLAEELLETAIRVVRLLLARIEQDVFLWNDRKQRKKLHNNYSR